MQVDEVLLAAGRVVEGDNVIIVAGSPPGIPGSTNALRVHRIGDAKNRVAPAYSDIVVPAPSEAGVAPSIDSTAPRPGWWNGRHGGLKILCPQGRAGSSPAPGT